MNRHVVIVGAGMGGLTAALRLARYGYSVTVLEARSAAGGLAAGFERDGLTFDAGPYVLLDRPGLDWAFRSLGLDPDRLLALRRLDPVYEVASADGVVRFRADAGETAAGLDAAWPGSGERYRRFVARLERVYRHLQPLQQVSRPGLLALLRTGGWRHAPFLLRSLASVLGSAGLPRPVVEAMSIWTHVAGQRVEDAPSPLALVCAVIHSVGAFYPVGGLGTVPRVLADAVTAAGVEVRYATRVRAIRCERGRVSGVETDKGDFLPADAVVSNHSGVGTYLDLVAETPVPESERLKALPLQSPGVCAYLAIKGDPRPPYLRFYLPGGRQLCRLLIRPAVMDAGVVRDGWQPARLLAPMSHADAERGPDAQRAHLERVLSEGWWREGISEHRLVATRIPAEWGAEYHLYRDSMNPVMTARFMRAGRLAHRSPCVPGLYLAGSSTHPGQWVSFCAVSGVLAADRVREDLRLMLAATFQTLPDGRRLRVARLGSGPPMVLLHGYPDNLQIWCELAPRLADRFEVIAFDWPGMGQSDDWPGGTTPMHMAERLRALLDTWGVRRAVLVGTDMGGQPALAFAALHPERTLGLVVMNSLLFGDAATSWEIRLLRRFGWNRLLLRTLPGVIFRRAERTFLPRETALPADLRADLWDSFRRPEVRRFISRLCAGYQGTLPRLPELYAQVRCPTLVLWGEHDRHFPTVHAERLHAMIRGSRLEIVAGAQHWMPWYRADEVADRVRRFVDAR